MRKIYALAVVLVFAGVTAFSLNMIPNDGDTDPRKSACETVAQSECSGTEAMAGNEKKSGNCGQAVNAVLTAGSEDSSCGSSAKAVKAVAADCGQAVNASLAVDAVKEAGCCSSAATAAGAVASECSGEKTEETRIAENQ